MISVRQIRATRALLNWTQIDLANRSKLSETAINNIEQEKTKPRESSLKSIKECFEENRIEFLEYDGVKISQERFEFQKISGKDYIDLATEDAMSCLNPGDEVVAMGESEIFIQKHSRDADRNYQLFLKKNKIRERIIVPEGTVFFNSEPSHYRFLPKSAIGPIYWIVYKDRFLLSNWKEKSTIRIRNSSIANTYLTQFNYLWRTAKRSE